MANQILAEMQYPSDEYQQLHNWQIDGTVVELHLTSEATLVLSATTDQRYAETEILSCNSLIGIVDDLRNSLI